MAGSGDGGRQLVPEPKLTLKEKLEDSFIYDGWVGITTKILTFLAMLFGMYVFLRGIFFIDVGQIVLGCVLNIAPWLILYVVCRRL